MSDRLLIPDAFDEARAERWRAHAEHGATSMESSPPDTLRRLAILTEEVGEVAREFNEAEHDGRPVDRGLLRKFGAEQFTFGEGVDWAGVEFLHAVIAREESEREQLQQLGDRWDEVSAWLEETA